MIAIALAVSITLNVCQAIVFWLMALGSYYNKEKKNGDRDMP